MGPMCGRYTLTSNDHQALAARFGAAGRLGEVLP